MHLRALREVTVRFAGKNTAITILPGEAIHTENSYKLTGDDIQQTGRWAGLELRKVFADEKG